LAWRAADLYVPPGLWGVGIGEEFLRGLVSGAGTSARLAGCLVLAPAPGPDDGPERQRQIADALQLYRGEGFARVETGAQGGRAAGLPAAFDRAGIARALGGDGGGRWLFHDGPGDSVVADLGAGPSEGDRLGGTSPGMDASRSGRREGPQA
ncbi:MAG TPA: hypothetical protein VMK65_06010, partial [Longimicrobiales bacterium]|nr:hypothetical protein [Longimicrobiales bacterium]